MAVLSAVCKNSSILMIFTLWVLCEIASRILVWGFTRWSQASHVPAIHFTSSPTFTATLSWYSLFKGHYYIYQRVGGFFCLFVCLFFVIFCLFELFFKSLRQEWRTAQLWVTATDHSKRSSNRLMERSPSLPNIWVTDTFSVRYGH